MNCHFFLSQNKIYNNTNTIHPSNVYYPKLIVLHLETGFLMSLSTEDIEKWTRDGRNKELEMSPSCSSFEVLDPHDPVISRLATQLFKKTTDYLQGEMVAGQEHYTLLEEINRLAITKYADLRNLAANLNKTLNEYNEIYIQQIQPLLQQIDQIEVQVSKFEVNAYRLDSYTKHLKARFKELEEK